jgi:ribonuclease P protein component
MLSSRNRLPKTITHLKGKRLSSSQMSLVLAANDLDISRMRVVVSKKVASRAVDRVRLKRQVKRCLRQYVEVLKGYDLIIILHRSALQPSASTFCEQINQLIDQLSPHAQKINS